MDSKDTPVIVERVGNGYQVRPLSGYGEMVCARGILVFQDKGFVSKASDGMKWLGVRLRDGIDPEAIREGRWSGPDDPEVEARGGQQNSAGNGPEWPTGDDPMWSPDDDF